MMQWLLCLLLLCASFALPYIMHVVFQISCLLYKCAAHGLFMCFKAPMLALSCSWLFMCFRGSHACSVLLFRFIVCSHVPEALMLALCCSFVFMVCSCVSDLLATLSCSWFVSHDYLAVCLFCFRVSHACLVCSCLVLSCSCFHIHFIRPILSHTFD